MAVDEAEDDQLKKSLGRYNFTRVKAFWGRIRFWGGSDLESKMIRGKNSILGWKWFRAESDLGLNVESIDWHSEGVWKVGRADYNTMNMDMGGTIHHSSWNPNRGTEGVAQRKPQHCNIHHSTYIAILLVSANLTCLHIINNLLMATVLDWNFKLTQAKNHPSNYINLKSSLIKIWFILNLTLTSITYTLKLESICIYTSLLKH